MQNFFLSKITLLNLLLFTTASCSVVEIPGCKKPRGKDKYPGENKLTELTYHSSVKLEDETLDLIDKVLTELSSIDRCWYQYFEDFLTAAILSRNMKNVEMVTHTIFKYYELMLEHQSKKQECDLYTFLNFQQTVLLHPQMEVLHDNLVWFEALIAHRASMRDEQKYWGITNGTFGFATIGASFINPFVGLGTGATGWLVNSFQKRDKTLYVNAQKERSQKFTEILNKKIEKLATDRDDFLKKPIGKKCHTYF